MLYKVVIKGERKGTKKKSESEREREEERKREKRNFTKSLEDNALLTQRFFFISPPATRL